MTPPDTSRAADDLQFIRSVMNRTHRRIDPHAFHFVLWGAIVLVWYPLANWLELQGEQTLFFVVMGLALAIGSVGSGLFEWRLSKRPTQDGPVW